MDFFSAQDHARRTSRLLVGWFAAAVVAIILIVYVVLAFLFGLDRPPGSPVRLWQPDLLLGTAVAVGGFILIGSLYRIIALASGGGAAVAESLGGRLVPRASSDPLECRLINVVDEMAVAAGIPSPPVYILDAEQGINAFAAGSRATEGIVAVTRGTLEKLSRDELQGVIAHEFSHILNGDMRLNLRLLGLLHGILLLTLIGRILARSARGKNAAPMIVMGLALIVTGYIGVLFGKIIRAAVSRQREFLADASAVQFTRNPAGIASALKRIAGFGSTLVHPRAEEASHMLFGSGMTLSRVFATHPPIEERIRRIDPSFDPRLEARAPVAEHGTSSVPGNMAGFSAGTLADAVGTVRPEDVEHAHGLLSILPASLVDGAHHAAEAQAIVFALLLSDLRAIAAKQLDAVRAAHGDLCAQRTEEYRADVRAAGREARLPLLDLALPALKELGGEARQRTLETVDVLIRADGRAALFEFAVRRLLGRALHAPRHGLGLPATPGVLREDIGLLLSLLARAGHGSEPEVEAAFTAGAREAPLDGPWRLFASGDMRPERIDRALDRLAGTVPPFRRRLVQACAAAVLHDGRIEAAEMEILRVLCEALDCPLPSLTGTA